MPSHALAGVGVVDAATSVVEVDHTDRAMPSRKVALCLTMARGVDLSRTQGVNRDEN
jgi:hypothetical protein